MSGVLWVETNHSWDEEMMIQINPIGSPNYLKRNITPDFELNDLASSYIINSNRDVGEGGHWTGKRL